MAYKCARCEKELETKKGCVEFVVKKNYHPRNYIICPKCSERVLKAFKDSLNPQSGDWISDSYNWPRDCGFTG